MSRSLPSPLPSLVSREVANLGDRLAVARSCSYRGQGQILQLPWRAFFDGLWVVVDLFGGCGGLLVALIALGTRFVAVHAEIDGQGSQ